MSAAAPGDAARRARAAASPLRFDAPDPDAATAAYLDDPAIRALAGWFRAKGLPALKAEDRAEEWYADWIEFQAREGLYAALLSPESLSTRGHRFDLRRLARFLEVFAYFSPAHAYSLHVSFLGLFPILTGPGEALKREAVLRLEGGGLFAFAVSEKDHGSDLFSNEFTLRPARDGETGPWIAEGAKYYIGNAEKACMVSVLATVPGAGDGGGRPTFAFVVLRPGDAPGFRAVAKIRTLGIRTAHVGSFEVRGHPLPESDVISRGREAWDAVFRTVDLGKFLLGFGVLGICEHALAEALDHLRRRVLYGRPASEIPHVRTTTALAFARLSAMKMYANRALEYVQAAGRDDRRYLLYCAVQKARVSTEGVKVVALLAECVGAKGVESETYFESALRDAQLVPGLEGSTHINFSLAAQFAGPYLAGPRAGEPEPPLPPFDGPPGENPYLFESRNRNAKTVRFADPLRAYAALPQVPNVRAFVRQVEAFRRFVLGNAALRDLPADGEAVLGVGKCLSCVAYAQLVAEECAAVGAAPPLVSVVFHALVEDLSAEALRLSAMLFARGLPREGLARAVRVPRTTAAEFASCGPPPGTLRP